MESAIGELGMRQRMVRFARAGDVNIAYQVVGDGPVDLVCAYGMASNLEVMWEEPSLAAFYRRLSEFTRLILFDRRGCGLSDRHGTTVTPTLEERVDDVMAVLDAVGSERASILGISEGGALAALVAATHPERIDTIIVYGTIPRFDPDTVIAGLPVRDFIEALGQGWGLRSEWAVQHWAPSMAGDDQFAEWLAKWCRQSVGRGAIVPLLSIAQTYDPRDIFPPVRVPTLVLHRRDDGLVPVGFGREIAAQIPNSRFVEVEGADHLPFIGDAESLVEEIEKFVVGTGARVVPQRRLLTLLFADVVGSAGRSGAVDGRAWRELRAAHDRDVRTHLDRFGGQEVKPLTDGVLAAFDGPARAIRCALGLADAADARGLSIRVGIHTGECEMTGDEPGGISVDVGARILELAGPGEILVSTTVRDLVAGSGVRFGEGRDAELTGIPGRRILLPVLRHGVTPDAARRLAAEQANVFCLDGEYWTIGHRGLVMTLRDSKGLKDLSRLLAEPGREFHVLDLMTPGHDGSTVTPAHSPIIDEVARDQYRRRIIDLQEDVDRAREDGDLEVAAGAQQEIDALIAALSAAYGLHGRARRPPDHVERARKAVGRRIRDAMNRIAQSHPRLGRHLEASVRTGTFCSYSPERPTAWSVRVS